MSEKVMIGFSTAQQSTNYIPYKLLQIDTFICLETGTAKRSGWTEGLANLLGLKEDESESGQLYIKELYSVDRDSGHPINESNWKKVHELAGWLKQLVDKRFHEDVVYFNIGGGQKNHALALWECFRMRFDDHKRSDIAVYTDPSTNVIEQYYFDEQGKLTAKPDLPLRLRNTSLSDIVRLFGYEESEDKRFYKIYRASMEVNGRLTQATLTPPLLNSEQEAMIQEPLVREYNFWVQTARACLTEELLDKDQKKLYRKRREDIEKKRKDILKELSNKTNFVEQLKALSKTTEITVTQHIYDDDLFSLIVKRSNLEKDNKPEERISYSKYVERILAYHFHQFIQSNTDKTQLNVLEGYANVKIRKILKGKDTGEYDLLLVTDQARLIALDAKTFSFDSKDFDARIHNLRAIAGQYIQFQVVMPFFTDDMKTKWWNDELNKELRSLPNSLTQKGVRFYVITDRETPFYINKDGNKWAEELTDKTPIQMTPIQLFFEKELKHKKSPAVLQTSGGRFV